MRRQVRHKLKQYVVAEFFLLFSFLLPFAFLLGRHLTWAKQEGLTAYEFLLLRMSDQYYLVFAFLPLFFLLLFRCLTREEAIFVLRYGSQKRVQLVQVGSLFLLTVFLLLTLAGLAYLPASAILRSGMAFTPIEANSAWLFLLKQFSNQFSNPLVAVMATLAYQCFGLLVLMTLFSFAQSKFPAKVKSLFPALYLLIATLFKADFPQWIKVFLPHRFYFFHESYLQEAWWVFGLRILFGLTLSFLILSPTVSTKESSIPSSYLNEYAWPKQWRTYSGLLLLLVLALSLLRNLMWSKASLHEHLMLLLPGVKDGQLSWQTWMYQTFLYLLPLFFLGASQQRLETGASFRTRFASRLAFEQALLSEQVKAFCCYELKLWGLLTFCFALVLGLNHQSIKASDLCSLSIAYVGYVILYLSKAGLLCFGFLCLTRWGVVQAFLLSLLVLVGVIFERQVWGAFWMPSYGWPNELGFGQGLIQLLSCSLGIWIFRRWRLWPK